LEIIAYPNPATETVWISGISGLIHVQAVSLSDIVLDEKEYESQGSPIEFPIRDSFGQQFIVKDARGVSQLLFDVTQVCFYPKEILPVCFSLSSSSSLKAA
jgi:hypothetical protein